MPETYETIRADRQAAVLAVVMTTRPSTRNSFELAHPGRDLEQMAVESMLSGAEPAGMVAWWAASSEGVIHAVHAVTGEDEATSSVFVGAALTVLMLAGADRAPADVVRVADRAVHWHRGRRWAEHQGTDTAQEVGARG